MFTATGALLLPSSLLEEVGEDMYIPHTYIYTPDRHIHISKINSSPSALGSGFSTPTHPSHLGCDFFALGYPMWNLSLT